MADPALIKGLVVAQSALEAILEGEDLKALFAEDLEEKSDAPVPTLEELINVANRLKNKQERLFFLLLYSTGLPAEVIAKLRGGDVDLQGGWISLKRNSVSIQLPISPELESELRTYLKDLSPNDLLFVSRRSRVKRPLTGASLWRKCQSSVRSSGLRVQLTQGTLRRALHGYLVDMGFSSEEVWMLFGILEAA